VAKRERFGDGTTSREGQTAHSLSKVCHDISGTVSTVSVVSTILGIFLYLSHFFSTSDNSSAEPRLCDVSNFLYLQQICIAYTRKYSVHSSKEKNHSFHKNHEEK
jgi:hypothetical protein